jgi:hypothetical protein
MNKEEERNDRNLDIHKEREYWEAYLKDYEDVILYVQGILLLRRPISFVFLSLTVFFYMRSDIPFVTLVSLCLIAYLILNWLSVTGEIQFSFRSMIPKEDPEAVQNAEGARLLTFTEILSLAIELKAKLRRVINRFAEMKKNNIHRFTFESVLVLAAIIYSTTVFGGLTIVYIAIYSVLWGPSIIFYSLHKKLLEFTRVRLDKLIQDYINRVETDVKIKLKAK